MSRLRRRLERLRGHEGFGLVELLAAMVILNVGLLAILAAFISGTTSIRRASRLATAATIAETQLELYRALTYDAIALDPSTIPASAPYATDVAYDPSPVTAGCPGSVADNPQCNASRTLTGPDHGSYELDTYISWRTPTNGRAVKAVTVVVRSTNDLGGPALARITSTLDESTGT